MPTAPTTTSDSKPQTNPGFTPDSYLNLGSNLTDAEYLNASERLVGPLGYRIGGNNSHLFPDKSPNHTPREVYEQSRSIFLNGIESVVDQDIIRWDAIPENDIEQRYQVAKENTPATEMFPQKVGSMVTSPPAWLTEAEFQTAPENVRQASNQVRDLNRSLMERSSLPNYGRESYYEPRKEVADLKPHAATIRDWRDQQDKIRTISQYEARLRARDYLRTKKALAPLLSERATKLLDHVIDDKPMDKGFKKMFETLPTDQQEILFGLVQSAKDAKGRNLARDSVKALFWTPFEITGKAGLEAYNTFRRTLMDGEAYQRQAEIEARLSELTAKSQPEYGYASRSVIGFCSSISYGALASTKVGLPLVAASTAYDMKYQIALNGGDVSSPQSIALSWAAGLSSAAIERVQFGLWKTKLTDIELRMAHVNLLTNLLKPMSAASRAAVAKSAPVAAQSALTTWIAETGEEMSQAAVESFYTSYGMDEDMAKNLAEEVVKTGIESAGTMAIFAVTGAGGSAASGMMRRKFTQQEMIESFGHRAKLVESYKKRKEILEKKAKGIPLMPGELKRVEKDIAYQRGVLSMLFRESQRAGTMEQAVKVFEENGLDHDTALAAAVTFQTERQAIMQDESISAEEKRMYTGVEKSAFELEQELHPNDTIQLHEDGSWTRRFTLNGKEVVEHHRPLDPDAFDPSTDAGATSVMEGMKIAREAYTAAGRDIPADLNMTKDEWLALDRKEQDRIMDEYSLVEEGRFVPGTRQTIKAVTVPEVTDADIESDDAAADVVQAMKQKAAAMPEGQTVPKAFSMTEEEWKAMPHQKKRSILKKHGMKEDVRQARKQKLTEKAVQEAKEVTEESLERLTGTVELAEGTQAATQFHEEFHGAIQYLREIGALSADDIDMLRDEFGDPVKDGELFNEENAANAYMEHIAAQTDFVKPTVLEKVQDGLKAVLDRIFAPRKKAEQEKTVRQTLFEQIQRGEYTGIPVGTISERQRQENAKARADEARKAKIEAAKEKADAQQAKSDQKAPAKEAEQAQEPSQDENQPKTPVDEKPPSDEEMAAKAELDSLKASEQESKVQPKVGKGEWRAMTPIKPVVVEGEWQVRDAFNGIITSRDPGYEQKYQRRNRNTVESLKQERKISRELTFEKVSDSNMTDTGAPILDEKSQDISGNVRVFGIRKAIIENTGAYPAYEAEVRRRAEELGITIPDDVQYPVLVRVIKIIATPNVTMEEVADLSNRDDKLQMTDAEVAEADAKLILDNDLLKLYQPGTSGDLLAASNHAFIMAFVNSTGANNLLNSAGRPTSAAKDRIQRAMLSMIVGTGEENRAIIRNLIENAEDFGILSQMKGILRAAALLVNLADRKPQYSILEELGAALNEYMVTKAEGGSVYQGDLLGRPAIIGTLMQQIYERKTAAGIEEFLRAYVDAANRIDDTTGNLLGIADATKEQLLAQAIEAVPIPNASIIEQQTEEDAADDARHSVRPDLSAIDNAYFKSVESGDVKAQQQIVDEAAKRAGYTVGPVWHGGAKGFTVFEWERMGQQGTTEGKGFYFTNDRDLARGYADRHGGRIMRVYLRGGKNINGQKLTLTVSQVQRLLTTLHEASESQEDGSSPLWNYGDIDYEGRDRVIGKAALDLVKYSEDDVSLLAGLINGGADPELVYDAMYAVTGKTGITEQDAWGKAGHELYVATSARHVKLADPITRDDTGRIIPPSQRFKKADPDIRFRVTARMSPFSGNSRAISAVANQILTGRDVTAEDAKKAIYLHGGDDITPEQLLTQAKKYAEGKVGETAKKILAGQHPEKAYAHIAASAELDAIEAAREGLKNGLKMGVAGQKAKDQAIKRAMALAKGEDLQQLVIDTGVDLTETLINVMPELFDEWKQQAKDDEGKDAGPKQDQEQPTPPPADPAVLAEREERTRKLVDIVKAIVDANRAKRQKEAEDRKKAADDPAAVTPDGDNEVDENAEIEEADIGELAIPKELLQGHGVDLKSAEEVALFMRMWIGDWIVANSNGRLTHETIWKDPEAVSIYRKTMVQQLHDLAHAMLEPEGWQVQHISDMIGDIPSKATPRGIESWSRMIIASIQANAIRQTRRELMNGIDKEIRSIVKKTKALDPDFKRKVTGEHEKTAKFMRRVLRMGNVALEAAIAKEQAIIDSRQEVYKVTNENNEQPISIELDAEYRRAMMHMQILNRWGGLRNKLPGVIKAEGAEITKWLAQAQERLLNRWEQFEKDNAEMTAALIAAVTPDDPNTPRPKEISGFANNSIFSIEQRLNSIIRNAKDPEVRARAEKAIAELMFKLGQASQRYHVKVDEYRQQFIEAAKRAGKGSVKRYMKHLESQIDPEIADIISLQGYTGEERGMTYGQAMQLYAGLTQKSYAKNLLHNGRKDHAKIIRSILTAEDLEFIDELRAIYEVRRKELSDVVRYVTGIPIWRPDPLYMPVQMDLGERGGLGVIGEVRQYNYLAKSLTPRVSNRRDFDEAVSIQDMYFQRSEDAARAVGYGVNGMTIRSVLGNKKLQDAIARHIGKTELRSLLRQATDSMAGMGRPSTDFMNKNARALRQLATYAYLAGNTLTTAKQTTSVPVLALALKDGFIGLFHHMANWSKEAYLELIASEGYKARYRGGINPEIHDILADHKAGWIKKLYKIGMTPVQWGDFFPIAIIGPGLYKSLTIDYMKNHGMSLEEAKERAMIRTWQNAESTQQSSRPENMPEYYRGKSDIARLVMAFSSAPLQQFSHEVTAFREMRAGVPGARARFIRSLVVNHVIMPASLYAVSYAFSRILLGRPPEDDEEKKIVTELAFAMLAGPFARLFVWGAVGESVWRGMFGQSMWGSQMIPAERLLNTARKAGVTVSEIANLEFDQAWETFLDILSDVSAPTRHIMEGYKNRVGED